MNVKLLLILSTLLLPPLLPDSSYAREDQSQPESHKGNGNGQEKPRRIPTAMEEMLLFFDESELFVTATKYPQRLQEAPAIATVITADEIKRTGARNLADILKRIPGFGVTRGYFGLYEVELRGMKTFYSEKIKLLMDGHSLNSTVNGGPSWSYDRMPLDNVKRIEIIRGPGSALYGSNAFVGVINIITKEGKDIAGTVVSGGTGSYDAWNVNVQTGKRFDDMDLALALDYGESIGPKLKIEKDSQGNTGYTDDWEKKFDAQLKAKYSDFTFNGKYIVRRRGPFIGALNAVNDKSDVDILQFFGDLTYKRPISEKLDLTVKGYMDEFDWDAYWQLLPASLYPFPPGGMIGNPSQRERNLGTELQVDFRPTEQHILTIGAMYEDRTIYDVGLHANYCSDGTSTDCVFGTPLGSLQDIAKRWNWLDEKTRYVKAVYLQESWMPTETLGITGGVRYDEYSDFGGTTNPRLAAVWRFLEGWDAKVMYGEAFRAPSNAELDIKNNPAVLGNTNLKPEKIKTYEVSIGHQVPSRTSYRLSYFNSIFTDKIQSTGTPPKYGNKGGAKVDGVEAELRWYFTGDKETYINGNFTHLRPEDEETGKDLQEIAKNRGNIELNVELNRYLNLNTNLLMVDERPRAAGDVRAPLPAYGVVDLALSIKKLYKGLEVRATVNNLFDQKYEDPSIITAPQQVSDIPKEGTNYFIKAEYRF